MKPLLLKLIANLKYESTLSGLTILAGLLGASLAPEKAQAIATATVALVGVLKLFLSDSDVQPPKPPVA